VHGDSSRVKPLFVQQRQESMMTISALATVLSCGRLRIAIRTGLVNALAFVEERFAASPPPCHSMLFFVDFAFRVLDAVKEYAGGTSAEPPFTSDYSSWFNASNASCLLSDTISVLTHL